ncbi:MAG: discoidin domain-containing protein [Candidatus Sumerlaeota bacterium]|nr:discoidin domain-containing protein [Candidatus Sumerlaeota bacterium]
MKQTAVWILGILCLACHCAFGAQDQPPLFSTSASSIHSEPYKPQFAFDGDPKTRWASHVFKGAPEWLQADFGAPMPIEKITILWEKAYASQYEIQISLDGKNWQTLARKTDGKGGKDSFERLNGKGRYLRIACLKPGSEHGLFSIWEVEFPDSPIAQARKDAIRKAEEEREKASAERMKSLLDALAKQGVQEIIFAARPIVTEHWYANFGYYAASSGRSYFNTAVLYRDGGKLYRLRLSDGKLTALVEDPKGGVRDPQVDYTGKKILFSFRKGDKPNFHLYEINADGGGWRQITGGSYDEIEPSYLPDGGIVFVSSRARRWVNCWLTQVATLHRCDADGSNLRPISSNNEQDNTPWPLPDGRILYTRWEYVDRSQVHYHHLWTANPDGTGQTVFYGNFYPGTVMIDAKPIPGTDKVLASFSPGHGRTEHEGRIAIVDPKAGPDVQSFAKVITQGEEFRDPYPISEDCFLAAKGASILLVNGLGETTEICKLPAPDRQVGLLCHEPRPLIARPKEPVIAARVDTTQATGLMMLANVYEGRNMAGVKPGEIKKLLVLETLPKPINFTGGMEPLSYGGTFTLERIVGTVPVAADGSAYFEAPALRSLFFVALDENNLSVKRMQSFCTVQQGETLGCVGCHESRVKTQPAGGARPLALTRPPSRIEPIADVPEVLDFPRDIQPILDRHCLRCHDSGHRKGGVVLSGDRGPMFSLSYYALTARNQIADGRNRPKSNYPPRALGSSASSLMKKLDPEHHDVKVSASERARLRLWIEIGAPYPGTYAALGCGMIGGYAQNHLDRQDTDWPATKAAMEAIKRRCGECHKGAMTLPLSVSDNLGKNPWEDMSPTDPRRRYSRHLLYNLTRPDKSLILLAPLAREAGGYALCKAKHTGGQGAEATTTVLANIADPDYRLIIAAIADAAKKLDEIKRFDMPGFHPRPEWTREMKRYGILPESLAMDAPVDYYAAEKKYWESLWPVCSRVETGR